MNRCLCKNVHIVHTIGFPMKFILTADTGFDFLSGFLVPKMDAWSWMTSTSMTALPRLLPPALRTLFRLLSDGPPPSMMRSWPGAWQADYCHWVIADVRISWHWLQSRKKHSWTWGWQHARTDQEGLSVIFLLMTFQSSAETRLES